MAENTASTTDEDDSTALLNFMIVLASIVVFVMLGVLYIDGYRPPSQQQKNTSVISYDHAIYQPLPVTRSRSQTQSRLSPKAIQQLELIRSIQAGEPQPVWVDRNAQRFQESQRRNEQARQRQREYEEKMREFNRREMSLDLNSSLTPQQRDLGKAMIGDEWFEFMRSRSRR